MNSIKCPRHTTGPDAGLELIRIDADDDGMWYRCPDEGEPHFVFAPKDGGPAQINIWKAYGITAEKYNRSRRA
jgi:hypothetical protein